MIKIQSSTRVPHHLLEDLHLVSQLAGNLLERHDTLLSLLEVIGDDSQLLLGERALTDLNSRLLERLLTAVDQEGD